MDPKIGGIDAAPQSHPGGQPPPYTGPDNTAQPTVTVVHPTTTVIAPTVVPAVVIGSSMSPGPTPFVCRSCNLQIVTRVERVSSWRTHLFAGLLCIFGLWPCVCIPYCVDSCKKAEHYCPHCSSYIGSYFG